MQPSNARPERSSVCGFSGNLTMVLYVPSRGKAVVLLSTMYHDTTTEGDEETPEIVLLYNKPRVVWTTWTIYLLSFPVEEKQQLMAYGSLLQYAGCSWSCSIYLDVVESRLVFECSKGEVIGF